MLRHRCIPAMWYQSFSSYTWLLGPLIIGSAQDCECMAPCMPSHLIAFSPWYVSLLIRSREWCTVAEPTPGEPLHAAHSHAAQRPELGGGRPGRGLLIQVDIVMGCGNPAPRSGISAEPREPSPGQHGLRDYELTPIRTPELTRSRIIKPRHQCVLDCGEKAGTWQFEEPMCSMCSAGTPFLW